MLYVCVNLTPLTQLRKEDIPHARANQSNLITLLSSFVLFYLPFFVAIPSPEKKDNSNNNSNLPKHLSSPDRRFLPTIFLYYCIDLNHLFCRSIAVVFSNITPSDFLFFLEGEPVRRFAWTELFWAYHNPGMGHIFFWKRYRGRREELGWVNFWKGEEGGGGEWCWKGKRGAGGKAGEYGNKSTTYHQVLLTTELLRERERNESIHRDTRCFLSFYSGALMQLFHGQY